MSLFESFMRGVARPAQLKLREFFSVSVDRYLGVITADESVARLLAIQEDVHRRTARSTAWTACWRFLRRVPSSPADVFLDIGCGAGRVVCAAARKKYRKVIGIEINPRLGGLARRNLESLRKPHAPGEIIEADATVYRVPDDVSVVFFYNPFQGPTLDRTLSQIYASYDRAPRRIVIAYANPVEHDRLLSSRRLRDTGRLQLAWRPTEDWRRSLAVQFYEVCG